MKRLSKRICALLLTGAALMGTALSGCAQGTDYTQEIKEYQAKLESLAAENETCVNMKLSPEEVVLNRGKEFELSLDLEESAEIWGIFASIGYDPEALELLGYTYGGIFTEARERMALTAL